MSTDNRRSLLVGEERGSVLAIGEFVADYGDRFLSREFRTPCLVSGNLAAKTYSVIVVSDNIVPASERDR